jgi:hypothetical protein
MRREKFIKEQEQNRILEKSGISLLNNANLISIDIQPEYKSAFTFDNFSFGNMINENYEQLARLTFLFNGPELGMISEDEYKWWLIEDCGIDENIIYNSYFFDKGYAFFRYCIDEGIGDDDVVDLIKFMIRHNINDSRDIDEEMWNKFMQEYNHDQSEVRDLLEYADDMIHIPELMDYLKHYRQNIVLCGGGVQECLKEVEIALMAMDKPYRLFTKYCY